MTWVPIQTSHEPGVTCTVQFIGSMVAWARNGSLIVGVEPLALRQALVDVADGLGDDAVLLARGAQILPDIGRTDLARWGPRPR